VKRRAHLAMQLILAVGPGAIGEQHGGNSGLKVDP
jgi:hypothetical protein